MLSLSVIKEYLNLPELLAKRIINQINCVGKERVEENEFVRFFLRMFMGSLEQKMLIAFKCYDSNKDEAID